MTIEHFMDMAWWALSAAPFMLGGFGGGSAPQPPQLNVGQSAELLERQLQLQQRFLPGMVATAGTASRGEDLAATRFGLGMLVNPSAQIYGDQIAGLNANANNISSQIANLERQLSSGTRQVTTTATQGRGKGRGPVQVTRNVPISSAERQSITAQIESLRPQLSAAQRQAADMQSPDFVDRQIRAALPQEFANRDRLLSQMDAARVSTPEYQRMQEAFGRGVTAQETESGALGNQLMQRAMDKVAQGGRLSPEASRDAVQAARAGMASRGMATGSAGLAAEMLNRDRFARQREMENLAFARGVQTEDLARRQTNTAMRDDTNRFNIGLLGQSAALADAERARQLAIGQDAYNFGLSTNPRMMIAGLGSPYANMAAPAMQMVAGARGLEPMYSGGSFGSSSPLPGMLGTLGGAALGAAGVALAPATFGTSLLPAMAGGAAIGGGLGGMFNR